MNVFCPQAAEPVESAWGVSYPEEQRGRAGTKSRTIKTKKFMHGHIGRTEYGVFFLSIWEYDCLFMIGASAIYSKITFIKRNRRMLQFICFNLPFLIKFSCEFIAGYHITFADAAATAFSGHETNFHIFILAFLCR